MEGTDDSSSRQRCNKGNEFNNKSVKPVVDDHITKAQVSKPMLNVNPITKPLTSVEGDNDSNNMQ